jgi:hypothetical protein
MAQGMPASGASAATPVGGAGWTGGALGFETTNFFLQTPHVVLRPPAASSSVRTDRQNGQRILIGMIATSASIADSLLFGQPGRAYRSPIRPPSF